MAALAYVVVGTGCLAEVVDVVESDHAVERGRSTSGQHSWAERVPAQSLDRRSVRELVEEGWLVQVLWSLTSE